MLRANSSGEFTTKKSALEYLALRGWHIIGTSEAGTVILANGFALRGVRSLAGGKWTIDRDQRFLYGIAPQSAA